MKIGNVDLNERVLVIAEIGNNHEGDFTLAESMIAAAAAAGAGAVKFQTIIPERLVSPADPARINQLRKFQFRLDQFEKLSAIANHHGVMFLSTPFDVASARFLEPLVPAFKIASGDNNFFPLIETIARTGKPILLSTGLADLAQIKNTQEFIESIWAEIGCTEHPLALLHCVTSYPTEPEAANLSAIHRLRELNPVVGYSDHTLGIEAATLSVVMGARIVEKHFTLDKNQSEFHDHKLSADPEEFKQLVDRIALAQRLLGDGAAQVSACEVKNMRSARRSVVAVRDIAGGSVITLDDLTWVRPGGGLSPGEETLLLGRLLKRNKRAGDMILLEDLG
jgi:N-acetylneuraminate synthase/N,N'-diacetyllegionaminate synthase